ncbi:MULTISPECIES: ABC transporter ATP-binding protein [Calditerrivibrio]|uniref:Cell division ATP-binding protein FtsE n=1 Tax=Calditerrivibrio nitroreducens TaxID=477976 RepID=A0A2J6WML9_9BACT|nr:MAG: ABC transporter ATP-binding protein [Calditerrivibrio nitroreducens]
MIEIRHLTKIYDDKIVLQNINLDINNGDFVVIMGPSGSGKSTFLSIISGLSRPTEGSVCYDDINISKLPESDVGKFRNSKIGFVFQKFNLMENLTVYENILPPVIIAEKKITKKDIFELLKRFEIDNLSDVKVKRLSGGEQQRVALARALVNDPELLIADEPTANLDYRLKNEVIDTFKKIHYQGKTIIVATHDRVFTEIEGARIINMINGKIAEMV